jgi:tetratricopeptide (TPR) repeat protein/predicted Ser/Thr protein kinase
MPVLAGDRLGPYEICGQIGAGGMGEVYKARDVRLDRLVAIKFAKSQFSERFEREARAVAALNHPHICQLYDIGADYLVFEYIDGNPLNGPMAVRDALRVAAEIVEGLEAAHFHGVIHRDLKPSNIMLTAHGVKILDFGLAKLIRDGHSDDTYTLALTRAGNVMGTPGYMAPEQWHGKPADARSDYYSFGCVLYELLTGKRPGRDCRPLKPASLDAIIRKCLAEDPDKRFQSAEELRAALARAGRKQTRHRKTIAVAGAVLLAAGGALFWRHLHPKPKLTDQDVIVVADFDNQTGDKVFDIALKQALKFELSQSPLLRAMDDAEIHQALRLSGRTSDGRLSGELARDICIREGQKAALEGSIVALGTRDLISLQAVNCQSGETFARAQAEATDKEHVVEALARATRSMRAQLGESLGMIESDKVAYKHPITTTSLEALRAFQLADTEFTKTGDSQMVIPIYRHATELDPNFALAFALLGARYKSVGDKVHGDEAIEKAFALRERATERERLFIEELYYRGRDARKNREIEELLARRFPRDPMFHGDLCGLYHRAGEPEKELIEGQAALRTGPKHIQGYVNVADALLDLNRIEEAKATLYKAIAAGLDAPYIHHMLLFIGYAQDDAPVRERETQWLTSHDSESITLQVRLSQAAALGHFHELRELVPQAVEMARQHPAGTPPQAILDFASKAEALAGECPSSSPPASGLVKALCDSKSTGKFVQQQAEKGHTEVVGPEAYVRGLAMLAEGNSAEAASQFARIVQARVANWGTEYAAAQVGLARSAKLQGDFVRAGKLYEDFFAFWKSADPDVPLLIEARNELGALRGAVPKN